MNNQPSHTSPEFDPEFPYRLTEDQHTRIYQVRHLMELMHNLASNRDEFTDVRVESIAVTCGLIGDLLDEAIPNLVWRKHDPSPHADSAASAMPHNASGKTGIEEMFTALEKPQEITDADMTLSADEAAYLESYRNASKKGQKVMRQLALRARNGLPIDQGAA